MTLLMFVAAIPASAAPLQQGGKIWANWTLTDINNASLTLGAISATVQVSNRTNVPATSGFNGVYNPYSPLEANFPGGWYTPTPPNPGEWLQTQVEDDSPATAYFDVTISFSQAVANPVFYFINLDSASVDFFATTTSSGGPVSLTRLSGNNEAEVTGTEVNSITQPPDQFGCEANDGTNPNGGCGTVQLNGMYQTITMRVSDEITNNDGDGFAFTLSKAVDSVGGVTHPFETGVSPFLSQHWRFVPGVPLAALAGVVLIIGSALAGTTVWYRGKATRIAVAFANKLISELP